MFCAGYTYCYRTGICIVSYVTDTGIGKNQAIGIHIATRLIIVDITFVRPVFHVDREVKMIFVGFSDIDRVAVILGYFYIVAIPFGLERDFIGDRDIFGLVGGIGPR